MIRSLSFILCLLWFTHLSAQPGALDLSFGGSGIVTAPVGSGDDVAQAIVVQPDGKILMAGYATIGSSEDFALLQYNVDGTLDASFSGDGKLTTAFSNGDDRITAAVLQPDGKIVVAGYTITSQDIDFAVARYLPDGSLDNTFSGDGKTSTNIGGLFDKAYAIALQPDNKILVAGTFGKNAEADFAIVRYNTNGSIDDAFGVHGITTISIGFSYDEVRAMALQPDGKIVLAGFTKVGSDYDVALARVNGDGTIDTGFGTDGKVITPIGNSFDYAHGVVLQPDEKILVVGYTAVSTAKYDFALLRYLPDGSLDDTFNGNGIATTAVGSSYDEGLALALQPDGKIISCGYSYQAGAPDFALVQYTTEGIVDSTFGNNGRVVTPIGSGSDQALALDITPEGKLLVAGRSSNGSNLDVAAARYFSGQVSGTINPFNPLSHLVMSPNPFTEEGVLEYDLSQDATLSLLLYDLQGKQEQSFLESVHRIKGHHQEVLHFASNLDDGMHILVIQTGALFLPLKVQKE